MKLWKPLAVGIGALAVATATFVPVSSKLRGIRLLPEPEATESTAFDPEQSVGLFVGVPKFSKDSRLELQYAADDAVDLAYMFSLDPRVLLVRPERVVIALSGRPKKDISQRRLEQLIEAGAKVESAEPSDILKLLRQQSAVAGPRGILIVSIATHGFTDDGIQYVLGSTSLFEYPETALPMPRLLDIASRSDARRSLFFVDACRDRIPKDVRGTAPAIAAPMIDKMGRVHGQAVFFAATTGGSAYEADGNGVFTKAVLEGMSCKAALRSGVVTFGTLKSFVEPYVRRWIHGKHNSTIRAATQVAIDGDSQNMPLSICHGALRQPPPDNVSRVVYEGSMVTAVSESGSSLWKRTVRGEVLGAVVADLDADASREVIVGAKTITVFDRAGNQRWSAEQETPLRQFLVEDLLRKDVNLQIVALWSGGKTRSRVVMYAADGQQLADYDHAGHLQHIAIDRPTSRHARKIVVAGIDDQARGTVALLDTKLERVWAGVFAGPVTHLEIIDYDNDAKRDIFLSTPSGPIYLDFAGKVLNGRRVFRLLGKRTNSR